MHLTPSYVTGDFNISDSTSNNTSDPCSYFFSSCLFFLDYISLRFHDLTERDIKINGLCDHNLAAHSSSGAAVHKIM